jgi:hypothetical protein
MPVTINGAAYTPDGKSAVTADADGTAYVPELFDRRSVAVPAPLRVRVRTST